MNIALCSVAIMILAIGVGSLSVSTYLEWRIKEPKYALIMKISTGLLAIGAILFSLSMMGTG